MRKFHARWLLSLIGACFVLQPVMAEPPPWAPAHGWRKKNDPFYVGYAGREWSDDYGIISGRCNTDEVLAAVGAVAGGVIGNRTASNRTVGTVIGAVLGGVVGNIGDRIDERDRACTGHALELARVGQAVQWRNPDTGLTYTVRPTRDLANQCREFEFGVQGKRASAPVRLQGCARDRGEWQLATAAAATSRTTRAAPAPHRHPQTD